MTQVLSEPEARYPKRLESVQVIHFQEVREHWSLSHMEQ
jgi:hypothetical protein